MPVMMNLRIYLLYLESCGSLLSCTCSILSPAIPYYHVYAINILFYIRCCIFEEKKNYKMNFSHL